MIKLIRFDGETLNGGGGENVQSENKDFTVLNESTTETKPENETVKNANIFDDETHVKEKIFSDEEKKLQPEIKTETKVGGRNPNTEAKLMVNVINIFFSRIFTLISGSPNNSKWKLDDEEKEQLIDTATDWFKDEQLMSSKKFFLLALFLIFAPMGGEAIAYRVKKIRLKKKNPNANIDELLEEEEEKENLSNITEEDILSKRRTNYKIDENGFYKFDETGTYIKVNERVEKAESKDYNKLVMANGVNIIKKYFGIV